MKRILTIAILAWLLSVQVASADITSNLLGYWKLDEGTGTTAVDSGSGGNNGTLTNGPTWVTGKIGPYSVNFINGGDDFITMGDIDASEGISTLTLAGWVKPTSADSGHIIAKHNVTTDGSWWLAIRGTDIIEMAVTNTTPTRVISQATITYSAGTWYHVAAVYNGSTIAMYLDGQPVGTPASQTGNIQNTTHPVYIGWDFGGTLTFQCGCDIDDVRVYSRALSASDITELYNFTGAAVRRPIPPIIFQ